MSVYAGFKKVVLTCFAGCPFYAVRVGMDLPAVAFYYDYDPATPRQRPKPTLSPAPDLRLISLGDLKRLSEAEVKEMWRQLVAACGKEWHRRRMRKKAHCRYTAYWGEAYERGDA